ncbi:MAG TPA: SET domain-containing protein-lysine N-methyltransferase [Xanthomonadaceae bacterium]|nr:SET domain-containing protein-lysine N-methyltransferase [Xanthomonadaceae bacterium]
MRKLKLRKSTIHGNGVFAATDIPTDIELIQYKGRLRTHAETDRLHDGSTDTGHTFLFTLNEKYVIDANVDGNWARWINHSCEPNCRAVVVEGGNGDARRDRVVIESIRPIRAGEELTYDYGITLDEPHTARLKRIWACRCGAKKCTGTMLKPKRRR